MSSHAYLKSSQPRPQCGRGRGKAQPVCTNRRYSNFTQSIYHSGDEEQFRKDYVNGSDTMNESTHKDSNLICINSNMYINVDLRSECSLYTDIDALQTINTFRYIFNKFKKGIFVRISQGAIKVFQPFSNALFTNEWARLIQIDPRFGSLEECVRQSYMLAGYKFYASAVNPDISAWYANNHLIRMENPINESDTNTESVRKFFDTLSRERTLPDCEFFVNRRDFPILRRDRSEPYNHIWGSKHPLVSFSFDKYTPILSMCVSSEHADVLMPTHDDWNLVSSPTQTSYNSDWASKIPTAVFRGSSTGAGTDTVSNMRLKIAKMSSVESEHIKHTHEHKLLDAGITKWNLRLKKLESSPYLQTTNISNLPFGLVQSLTPLEQSNYKYVVCIEGHVSAFRLSRELSYKSVILLVKSQWQVWYSKFLVAYTHYVPVKADLSNLLKQVQWCIDNDAKCEKIADNARVFYETYICKDSMFDYMQKLLVDLKTETGSVVYPKTLFVNRQESVEETAIIKFVSPKSKVKVSEFESVLEMCIARTWRFFNAIRLVMRQDLHKGFPHETSSSFFGRDRTHVRGPTNSILYKSVYCGTYIVVKKQIQESIRSEMVHEIYTGLECINALFETIPTFSYTFGYYMDGDSYVLVKEYIDGPTLQQYTRSKDFCMDSFCILLSHISLSIYTAQRTCSFVHADLMPWNIILKKASERTVITYPISDCKNIHLCIEKGEFIPVITDFGKSHVVVDGVHHGRINMFSTSYSFDMYSLVVSVIADIGYALKDKSDINKLMYISSYFYSFNNIDDLCIFAKQESKYARLINKRLHDTDNASDFFTHLSVFKSVQAKIVQSPIKPRSRIIPIHLLEFASLKSFETKISVIYKNLPSLFKNRQRGIACFYNKCQIVDRIVCSMVECYTQFGLIAPRKFEDIKEKIYSFLEKNTIKAEKYILLPAIDVSDLYNKILCSPTPYTEDILLSERSVISLQNEVCSTDKPFKYRISISKLKTMLHNVLDYKGRFALGHDARMSVIEQYKNILSIDTLVLSRYESNAKTLFLLNT